MRLASVDATGELSMVETMVECMTVKTNQLEPADQAEVLASSILAVIVLDAS